MNKSRLEQLVLILTTLILLEQHFGLHLLTDQPNKLKMKRISITFILSLSHFSQWEKNKINKNLNQLRVSIQQEKQEEKI